MIINILKIVLSDLLGLRSIEGGLKLPAGPYELSEEKKKEYEKITSKLKRYLSIYGYHIGFYGIYTLMLAKGDAICTYLLSDEVKQVALGHYCHIYGYSTSWHVQSPMNI